MISLSRGVHSIAVLPPLPQEPLHLQQPEVTSVATNWLSDSNSRVKPKKKNYAIIEKDWNKRYFPCWLDRLENGTRVQYYKSVKAFS